MDDLPLLELFTRLCEAGLPLGVRDYEAVLEAVRGGFGLPDRSALARLCRTLWVRSPDERRLFDYYFERLIGSEAVAQTSDAADDELARKTSKRRKNKRLALYAGLIGILVAGAGIALWLHTRPTNVAVTPSPLPSTVTPSPLPSTVTPSASPTPPPTNPTQESSNGLVWLLLLILALSAGAFGLVKFWLQRRQQSNASAPESSAAESSAKLAPVLLRETSDAVQVAQAVRQITSQGNRKARDRFVFSGDYLPVTQRQMKQSWRHLRRMVRDGAATELDVDGTVQRIAHDGILLEPVLVARRTNRMKLVLLIDQDGSMVSFHSLSARLAETALRGGRLGKAGIYYFHNCPIGHLYHDPMHYEAEPIEDVFAGLRREHTVVLIFSDAGAARGGLNLERARLTAAFLQQLNRHVRYVAWLNPVPKDRWATSTAREIALHVPMFEATRQGLDAAIDALRGRHQFLEEIVRETP